MNNKTASSIVLVTLVGITGLLHCLSMTKGHNWGDDFSSYIMQAKSIVEGNPQGFIEANRFTIQQSSYVIGPVAYPWGFPAMLAPFYSMFALNMIALKSVGVAAFLLIVMLLWCGFRKYHTNFWLVCLVCLFSLNPSLVSFTNNILSDIPFLLFSTLSVLLIGRIVLERRGVISGTWDSFLLGISIAGAYLVRTNGILLLVTLGITQFIAAAQKHGAQSAQYQPTINTGVMRSISLRRFLDRGSLSYKDLFVNAIPYTSFACIIIAWSMIFPEGGTSHLSMIRNLSLSIIKQNILYYLALPTEFFTGVPYHSLLYWLSIPICLAGLTQRRQSDCHIIVYVLLTFLFYILWPAAHQGLRFLYPVLPFYFSFVLTGLSALLNSRLIVELAFLKTILILPMLFVLLFLGIHTTIDVYYNLVNHREISTGPFTENSMNMFEFIKQNTDAESKVVFFKPRAMRMMTGRKSILINRMAELSRGDFLCLHLKIGAEDQISPNVIERQGNAKPIYENGDFRVYRVMEILDKPHHADGVSPLPHSY